MHLSSPCDIGQAKVYYGLVALSIQPAFPSGNSFFAIYFLTMALVKA